MRRTRTGSPARPSGPARRRPRRTRRPRRSRRPTRGSSRRWRPWPAADGRGTEPAEIRDGNTSSGIQLTPRAKIGEPLTTNVNAAPVASAEVSSSTVRNPRRRAHVSTVSSVVHELDLERVQRLVPVRVRPPATHRAWRDGQSKTVLRQLSLHLGHHRALGIPQPDVDAPTGAERVDDHVDRPVVRPDQPGRSDGPRPGGWSSSRAGRPVATSLPSSATGPSPIPNCRPSCEGSCTAVRTTPMASRPPFGATRRSTWSPTGMRRSVGCRRRSGVPRRRSGTCGACWPWSPPRCR